MLLIVPEVLVLGQHLPPALPHKWVKHPLENPILFNYFAKQTQLSSWIRQRNCLQKLGIMLQLFCWTIETFCQFWKCMTIVTQFYTVLMMKWQNSSLLWNTDCKRVVWGPSVEGKMGGYYHYIGTLSRYQRRWRGHNCTCHNWPLSAPTQHPTLSSSMSSLTLRVTVATKIAAS